MLQTIQAWKETSHSAAFQLLVAFSNGVSGESIWRSGMARGGRTLVVVPMMQSSTTPTRSNLYFPTRYSGVLDSVIISPLRMFMYIQLVSVI